MQRAPATGVAMLKVAPNHPAKREVIHLDSDEDAPVAKKVKPEPKPEPKPKPTPELAASSMSRVGLGRLTKEVRDFRRRNAEGMLLTRVELGLEFELVDPDRLDEWRAKW